MDEYRDFIQRLVQKGGPDGKDYSKFDTRLAREWCRGSQFGLASAEI